MGRLITWIVLALFVLVVPFGSWYYLNSGLQYRKSALRELARKDSLDAKLDTLNIFKGKTTIYISPDKKIETSTIDNIVQQYGKAPSFQVILGDSLPKGYLTNILGKFSSADFVLIDTARYIRQSYKGDIDGIRKLVEHTAIVLPRAEEVDIKMKPSNE
jgi:hypothetical protein